MAVNINVPSQVKTYANLAAFPASGALKTIYIAEDTNKTYRWTGSVYVEVSAAGATGITIGTTAIASGTVGRVLFEGTGNVVQESANLFWDETNGRLGIGTNAPSNNLQVLGASGTIATVKINTANRATGMSFRYSDVGDSGSLTYNNIFYFTRNDNTFPLYLSANSNVLINTITDAGFRLDVNGTARISGNINSISTGLLTHSFFGATGYYALIGTSSSSGGYAEIYRPTSTKTLSINNGDFDLNLGVKFNYTGLFGILIKGATGNVLINTTTDAGFKLDVNGTARVQSLLSVNGTDGISLYGTTNLELFTGSGLAIMRTLGNVLILGSNNAERMRLSGTNILIGTTTDAGFKLDVNGTARFNNSVIAQTVSSVNVLDVSNIRIADDGNGRYIQAVNGFTLRATATPTTNFITLSSNSANNWKTTQTIGLSPSGGNGGVLFSSTATAGPSNSIMTFVRQRNDSGKSAIINTEDFASSGNVPINMFIYSGKETVLNNQANLILCHDGTIARGNTLIGTATNVASAIVNVESTTQGFLPPRMTTTQKNAIVTPATGLMVYDTTLTRPCFYDGTTWITL